MGAASDAAMERAIAKLADSFARAMLVLASTRHVAHARFSRDGTAARVDFFVDGRWQEVHRTDASLAVYPALLRRLADYIGQPVPDRGSTVTGRTTLSRRDKPPVYVLLALAYIDESEPVAYCELVDEATHATGRAPTRPS